MKSLLQTLKFAVTARQLLTSLKDEIIGLNFKVKLSSGHSFLALIVQLLKRIKLKTYGIATKMLIYTI